MTSPFEWGDRLWERIKARSPRLQAADATDDATHTHHALVTVLLFGSLGAALLSLHGESIEVGLRVGFVAGWVFYLLRELVARIGNWNYKRWDGWMDVLEPLVWTAPVVFSSARLLWALSLVYAVSFFLLRPVP